MSMDYRKYVPEITAHEPRAFLIHALCLGLRHGVNHQPDSQRETPTKRIALAEVHKLCAVVFDFLKYGVLLLRQRSGQFLLYSVTVLTSAGEVISLTSSSAVELSAVAFSELPDEQPESIKVDDTARDKIRRIPMIRIIVFFIQ